MAAKGDMRAWKEIFDRVEGKPVSRVEFTGANGEEIKGKLEIKAGSSLLDALSKIYALGNPGRAATVLPLPASVGERPITPEDSEQK